MSAQRREGTAPKQGYWARASEDALVLQSGRVPALKKNTLGSVGMVSRGAVRFLNCRRAAELIQAGCLFVAFPHLLSGLLCCLTDSSDRQDGGLQVPWTQERCVCIRTQSEQISQGLTTSATQRSI
jgi:hypothetical protein